MSKPFLDYHEENPEIYNLFDMFAQQAITAGRKTLSARLIIERIRWYTLLRFGADGYKINNNYHPHYARMWMDRNNAHGTFRTREIKTNRDRPAAL